MESKKNVEACRYCSTSGKNPGNELVKCEKCSSFFCLECFGRLESFAELHEMVMDADAHLLCPNCYNPEN